MRHIGNRGMLVCCHASMSRSPAILLACFLGFGCTINAALDRLKLLHPKIDIRPELMGSLMACVQRRASRSDLVRLDPAEVPLRCLPSPPAPRRAIRHHEHRNVARVGTSQRHKVIKAALPVGGPSEMRWSSAPGSPPLHQSSAHLAHHRVEALCMWRTTSPSETAPT